MLTNNSFTKMIVPLSVFFIIFLAINYFFMSQNQANLPQLMITSIVATVLFGLLTLIFNKYKTSK